MKKVLFTLATLFACMTMFAQGQATPFCGVAPVIVFGDADGNEITEVTVTPGVDVECSFILKSIDDQVYMVSGFQTQWKMFDASHANIDFATDAKVFCPKVYGGRVKGWLNPVGIGTSDENAGGFDGVSLSNEVPYANVYRVMGTNTKYNRVFFHDDADGNPTCPAVFGKFTIRTSEDWADEYATFEFDKAYTLWNQCPGDDPNVFEEASNTEDCVLMIKNANYVAPVTLADPVIAFAEENNVLTVTVSCETEGATLIVNGVAVEGNPYTYTVAHDDIYAEQVVNVTAQSVLGDQTSAEVTNSYTFQAQQQPTEAETPVITFNENPYNGQISSVQIVVTNATSYTVTVDGEPYNSAFVQASYEKEQVIVVEAENNPGAPYTPAYATGTYTLNKLNKKAANAPTITTNTTATEVTVTVTKDPNTDGELVYDGQYSYPRLEADYEVTVTAYTAEGATYLASEPTTITFIVPAYIPPTPVETSTFVKVTSADQLVAGKHYIFVYENGAESYAMGAINDNSYGTAVAVSLNGEEAEASEEVTVFTLGETGQSYYAFPTYATFAFENGSLLGGVRNGTASYNYTYGFMEGGNYTVWRLYTSNGNVTAMNYQYDRYVKFSNNAFTLSSTSTVPSAVLYVEKPGETPEVKDLAGEIVVSQPDENGVVTVSYVPGEGDPEVTVTVNGEPLAESYQLEDGVPMTFNVVVSAEGYNDKTAEETRTWNKPAPAVWADPVVVVDDAVSADGFLYATITWEEGGDLYIDGEKVEGVASPYRYKIAAQSLQDQEGAFFCQVKGEGRENSNNVRVGWNLPAREATYAPAPVLNWDETTFTMTATLSNRADYEIVMMRDGVVCENPCTVAQTYVPQTIMFSAYTKKIDEDYNSETVYKEVTVPAKEKTPSAEPTISVAEGDDAYVITGNGTGTVVMYDAEGNEIDNPYTVVRTNEQQVIIITVENTDADTQDEMFKPTSKVFTVIVPAKADTPQPTTVGQPTFQGYTVDGVTGYGVYIFPSEPADADIMYRVLVWDPVAEDWTVRNDWTEYTGEEKEIWFENNGEKVRVEAYAYVGENKSETAAYEFTVETALNELMGGKAVAGVRYFNMAGQEMQEANGMTIVVTTYTDGTTSAVKVMK